MPRTWFLIAALLLLLGCSLNRSPNSSATFGARGDDEDAGDDRDAAALRDAAADASADGGGEPDSGGGGSGGDADAGNTGGSGGGGACGDGCPDSTPVCLSPSGRCVECARDSQCESAEAPHCDTDSNACVQCTEDAHCSGDAPRCELGTGTCVPCLAADDCTDPAAPRCDPDSHACAPCASNDDCGGDTPFCDLDAQRCAQCLASEHCTDARSAECHDGTCGACTSDDACAGHAGATLCDKDASSGTAGECVQCTVTREQACNGMVCDPEARRCTDRPLASKTTCRECIADSECVADHRCVALEFQGQRLPHAYCMKQMTAGCARPFAAAPIVRESRSGVPAESYCGIDEESTTCTAVTALVDDLACQADTNDAAACGSGAMCRSVNGVAGRCTYACGAASQCPIGFMCGAGYCGSSN